MSSDVPTSTPLLQVLQALNEIDFRFEIQDGYADILPSVSIMVSETLFFGIILPWYLSTRTWTNNVLTILGVFTFLILLAGFVYLYWTNIAALRCNMLTFDFRRQGIEKSWRSFMMIICIVMYALAAAHWALDTQQWTSFYKESQQLEQQLHSEAYSAMTCIEEIINLGNGTLDCDTLPQASTTSILTPKFYNNVGAGACWSSPMLSVSVSNPIAIRPKWFYE